MTELSHPDFLISDLGRWVDGRLNGGQKVIKEKIACGGRRVPGLDSSIHFGRVC